MPLSPDNHPGSHPGDTYITRKRTTKTEIIHAGPISVAFENHWVLNRGSQHTAHIAVGHHSADIRIPGSGALITLVDFAQNHKPRR